MRPLNLHIAAAVVAFVAINFTCCATGYQISLPNGQLENDERHLDTLLREKRQMENFDDAEFSGPQQEAPDDPSFWDRVVRVAIKLFSKFVEWLNS